MCPLIILRRRSRLENATGNRFSISREPFIIIRSRLNAIFGVAIYFLYLNGYLFRILLVHSSINKNSFYLDSQPVSKLLAIRIPLILMGVYRTSSQIEYSLLFFCAHLYRIYDCIKQALFNLICLEKDNRAQDTNPHKCDRRQWKQLVLQL